MNNAAVVSEAQLLQFRTQGYCVFESALTDAQLDGLRSGLQAGIEAADARMDELGTDVDGITHRGSRYFIANADRWHPPVRDVLCSDVMAEICLATLGPQVWHFFNQYVVKFADAGMEFEWHQDSGYVAQRTSRPHRPYLSCWCPLDDVDEDNGTIYVLPYARAGTREVVDHSHVDGKTDLVGYSGADPGDPVIAPAGSVVAFSSVLLHRSGANRTSRPRRVFLAQYSAEPIMLDDGLTPVQGADPFLAPGMPPRPPL